MLPRLRVDGKYMVNEFRQRVQLSGAGWMDASLGEGGWNWYLNGIGPPSERARQMKELKANTVLIPVYEPKWADDRYKAAIDEGVQACVDNDLYCIIRLSYPSSGLAVEPTTTDWINRNKELATRYAAIPNVFAIYIINEPNLEQFARDRGYTGTYDEVRPYGQEIWHELVSRCAQGIASVNPSIIICFPDFNSYYNPGNPPTYTSWASAWDPYWIETPIPVPSGLIHALHYYYWKRYMLEGMADSYPYTEYEAGNYEAAKRELEKFWRFTAIGGQDAGYCMMCDEFGFKANPPAYPEAGWPQCMHDTIAIFNQYSIHWNYWLWWFHYPQLADPGYGTVLEKLPWSYPSPLSVIGEVWSQHLTGLPTPIPPIKPLVLNIAGPLLTGLLLWSLSRYG